MVKGVAIGFGEVGVVVFLVGRFSLRKRGMVINKLG